MDLRSWVRLLTVVVVYSLCYSNGILDSPGNSDASDNIVNNISEDSDDIYNDNQSETTKFEPSGQSADDQTDIRDGESGEETGILTSNVTGISVDGLTDISTEEQANDKTIIFIEDINGSTDSQKPTNIFSDNSTVSPKSTDISYDNSTLSIKQHDITTDNPRVSTNTTSTRPNDMPDTPTRISSIYSTAALFNRDSGTTTSEPGSDSVVISIDSYLPEIERLCPGINVCGRTSDYDGTMPTYEINHCCFNCSCESSCIKFQNCCYDDIVDDAQHKMFACLMPVVDDYGVADLSEMPAYRFVVAPPMDGCKTDDDITIEKIRNVDEKISPWGDFYPVYSKYFDLNFKNEKIAICHGAIYIEYWKPMAIYVGIYQGSEALTNFFRTFNSSDVFIMFEPPRPEIIHRDYMCFHAIGGTCPIQWTNTFIVPSYFQTDRKGIVAACEHGPRALYLVSPTRGYKNVYCALCSALIPLSHFDECRYNDVDGVQFRFRSFFVVLLGSDFIDSVNIKGADLRGKPTDLKCYSPEKYVNDDECVSLQCPMFQIRLADSQCGYPSALLLIESISVRLNLSTTNTTDATFINNMTEAELHSLFQRFSPWKGCWEIVTIGLRLEINTTEFFIHLVCKAEQFKLSNVNKGIRRVLSKTWLVPFNNIMQFKQQLDKHGNTYTLGFQPNLRHTNFAPDWTALASNTNRSSSLMKKLIWKQLYQRYNFQTLYNLKINKLFFCNQIELRNIEYEIQFSILYLKRMNKQLYPDEYSLFQDGFSSQRARVCLEDSGYIKAGSDTMAMHTRFVVMICLCLELLATLANLILCE